MESRLIHRVDPEYPTELKDSRPSGQVILSIVIGKNGEVQQVEVMNGDEGNPGLNSAAANAVSQWRYKPFVLDGIPVPVRTTVVVRFPHDASVPQTVNLKNKIGSQIRHTLERAQKELDRAKSEMEIIDLKDFRRQLENARKELERAGNEMAAIDMKEFRQKFRELEEMIEEGK